MVLKMRYRAIKRPREVVIVVEVNGETRGSFTVREDELKAIEADGRICIDSSDHGQARSIDRESVS